jgi:hypothetical protein
MTFPAVPLSNPWSTGFVNATTMYNNTTLPLNEIQAVLAANGTGSVAHVVLGSNVNFTTTTTFISQSINMVAGRKYAALAYYVGLSSATSIVNVQLASPAASYVLQFQNVTGVVTLYGTAVAFYAPGTSGPGTWSVAGSISAGTGTCNAGSFFWVIDLGTT